MVRGINGSCDYEDCLCVSRLVSVPAMNKIPKAHHAKISYLTYTDMRYCIIFLIDGVTKKLQIRLRLVCFQVPHEEILNSFKTTKLELAELSKQKFDSTLSLLFYRISAYLSLLLYRLTFPYLLQCLMEQLSDTKD